MPILFPDTELKCEKCGEKAFEEIPFYMYKEVNDKKGKAYKRELCYIKLKCAECGTIQTKIKDLQDLRIIE